MASAAGSPDRHFPTSAGILFGLGLGGFFDGIVLHQLLQWHHMLSSWYPVNTIENLKLNTRWDGIFHSSTYLFVVAGLFILWRTAQRRHLFWSTKLLVGTMLMGFGALMSSRVWSIIICLAPSRERTGRRALPHLLGHRLHSVGRSNAPHRLGASEAKTARDTRLPS
jgi:uncharacterized membrane protein